ncbi:hypothetical protein GLYMA_20G225051v4 [Glycine max]|nr:hypothetical protein GLYMA_20G225051v4 [Glycine max]KAH1037445.1 hypothetical protein GYH30_056702 [Glycine max]
MGEVTSNSLFLFNFLCKLLECVANDFLKCHAKNLLVNSGFHRTEPYFAL